jgi:hypothetical protein
MALFLAVGVAIRTAIEVQRLKKRAKKFQLSRQPHP